MTVSPPQTNSTAQNPAKATPSNARFVTGSIGRHVVVLTLTSAIGLMAMFLVDFADLYFLALLGKTEITAAIGYAGMIAFASLSISIGVAIAGTALVAQNLGAGREPDAKHFATSTLVVSGIIPLFTALVIMLFADEIIGLLGARGETQDLGALYLRTLVFGLPLLGAGLCASFILRAIGDAKRAMYVTLTVAVVNGILDPIFIFGFDLSIQGAALATVCANIMSFSIGFYALTRIHKFPAPLDFAQLRKDLGAIRRIAIPASLTQLATPFAIGYLTWSTSAFGDEAVSGTAIVNRLVPVAFGIVFALSSSVGPIIGQNFGALDFGRVRQTLNKSVLLTVVHITIVSIILWLLKDLIPVWFKAKGDAITIIVLFCTVISITWMFAGMQFVAQAAFNTLGKPTWSLLLNWGKATIGTVPFVITSTKIWGFQGILIGYALGTIVFGIIAISAIYLYVGKLEKHAGRDAI